MRRARSRSISRRSQKRGFPVAIPVPAKNTDLLKNTLFERFRIEIPVTPHGNLLFIRLSLQGYNTHKDPDALVYAVREIYKRDANA